MIGRINRLKGFKSTARYLVTDRPDRVAWQTTRGLLADDAKEVAKEMEGRAKKSTRVQKPGLHISVNLHPDDEVTREELESIMDQTLEDLELDGYQALYVAHNDTDHIHAHALVNRVGTDSKAWDPAFSYRRIRQSMDDQERARGLRITTEQTRQKRMAKENKLSNEFRTKLDNVKDGLKKANSEEEMNKALAKQDLSLKEGHITDGNEKISAFNLKKAYDRGGPLADQNKVLTRERVTKSNGIANAAYMGREVATPVKDEEDTIEKPVRIAAVIARMAERQKSEEWTLVDDAEHHADAKVLEEEKADLMKEINDGEDRLRKDDLARNHADTARQGFDNAMSEAYVNPEEAKLEFRQEANEKTIEEASRQMRETPSTFGNLHSKDGWFNRNEPTDKAWDATADAATHGKALYEHQKRLMSDKARKALEKRVGRAKEQAQKITKALGKGGSRDVMKRLKRRGITKGKAKALGKGLSKKASHALNVASGAMKAVKGKERSH